MNKIIVSSILLVLCASSSINSMLMNTYPQMRMCSTTLCDSSSDNTPITITLGILGLGSALVYLYNKYSHNDPYQKITSNNKLWIGTSDNKTFLMDIRKDLPPCGLQFLLKRYNKKFNHHNSEKTPLKTACSLSDYQLLRIALNAINNSMSQWKFTESEQIRLFDMASSFKILTLYLALMDPSIKTNAMPLPIDINKYITPFLYALNKEEHTLQSKIAMFATKTLHAHNAAKQTIQNKKYTNDRKYYIKDATLYNADTDELIIKIPQQTTWTLIPNKNCILLSSTKKNILFIYDITNKKKHYLPITSLKGCPKLQISPDGNYIATFSGMNSNGEYDESLIHIWDISNIDIRIKFYILPHPGVNIITFNPNSTFLISGANNNSVELWNLAKLSNKNIPSTTLLINDTIDKIKFNKDGKILAIKHSSDIFTHHITLINTETLDQQTVFPIKKYPSFIFPDNSPFIMFSIYDQQLNKPIFKIITETGIELYSKTLPNAEIIYEYSHIMSKNNHYMAINYSDQQKFDLLTIDELLHVTKKTIEGSCDYINSDGSFYTHTLHAIRLYDIHAQYFTTLHENNTQLINAVKIIPNKHFEYAYSGAKEDKKDCKQLLNKDAHRNIKNATKTATLLQYMLIKKACDKPRKQNKMISIKNNSLNHHTLQSFGEYEKLITKTLELRITNK